jgi:hypothetical protein
MKHGVPFRAAAMFAATLAAMVQTFGAGTSAFKAEAARLEPYQGRGKGRAVHHDNGGTRRAKRAAVKRRNIKRFKAQSKG